MHKRRFFSLATAIAAFLVAPLARADHAQFLDTNNGLTIAKTVNQKVSFHGVEPVAQLSGTAELAISDSTGGVIAAPVTITTTVASGTVVATGTGTRMFLAGILPGDVVVSALVSGTNVAADLEATITAQNNVLRTGASVLTTGASVVLTVGRNAQYYPLVTGSSTANINADIATLSMSVNELRRALVLKGFIKGSP